jgi:1-acyl-sn-glycerol-3-phosphate acyltransferase
MSIEKSMALIMPSPNSSWINALIWVPILLVYSSLKLMLPFKAVRLRIDPILLGIAENWIWGNSAWMALTQRTTWDVQGLDGLEPHSWYMVNSNHQSWVDILVLQHLLNRRIRLLKFFLKQHPEMRGKDQETTRKACAKYALIPSSVMNFLEGTRFTPVKHARQQSPYRHLLKPKDGGMALALNAMGDKFQAILDVTIVYPDGPITFTDFLRGKLRRVIVRVRSLPITKHLMTGDYAQDPAFREAFFFRGAAVMAGEGCVDWRAVGAGKSNV